jgi:hypothetical protein
MAARHKLGQVVVLFLAALGVPATVLGGDIFSVFVCLLGLFLLLDRLIFPSFGRGTPPEINRLQRPVGIVALSFGVFQALDARHLVPETGQIVFGCLFALAMAWFTVALGKLLRRLWIAKRRPQAPPGLRD